MAKPPMPLRHATLGEPGPEPLAEHTLRDPGAVIARWPEGAGIDPDKQDGECDWDKTLPAKPGTVPDREH